MFFIGRTEINFTLRLKRAFIARFLSNDAPLQKSLRSAQRALNNMALLILLNYTPYEILFRVNIFVPDLSEGENPDD